MKPSVLPPELSKTVYFTPLAVLTAVCYSNNGFATVRWVATVPVVLNFLFFIFFGEFLKNHKMKNLILLDSTGVDLHSKYIIRYALVQIFFLALD